MPKKKFEKKNQNVPLFCIFDINFGIDIKKKGCGKYITRRDIPDDDIFIAADGNES